MLSVLITNPGLIGPEEYKTFIEDLSQLSSLDRNAALGLLAGLAPTVVAQEPSRDSAEDHWDKSCRRSVSEVLDVIKQRVPIAPSLINNIGKHVYVTRSFETPYRFIYATFLEVIKNYEINTENTHYCSLILESCYSAIKQFSSLSALPYSGNVDRSVLDKIIGPLYEKLDNTSGISSETWRNVLCSVLRHMRWFVNAGNNDVCPITIKGIIDDMFGSDMLPSEYIDQDYDITNIVKFVINYRYDLQYMPETETAKICIYNSNESYLESEKEIDFILESLDEEFIKLDKANVLYNSIITNGYNNVSLESLEEVIEVSDQSNLSEEYALESIGSVISTILTKVLEYLIKLIPLIIAFLIGVVIYKLKKSTSEEHVGKQINELMDKHASAAKDPNAHSPANKEKAEEYLRKTFVDVSKENANGLHSFTAFKLLRPDSVYSISNLLNTITGHAKYMDDVLLSLNETMRHVKMIFVHNTDSAIIDKSMQGLKHEWERRNFNYLPYETKYFYEEIVKLGGIDRVNLNLEVHRVQIRFNSPELQSFWSEQGYDLLTGKPAKAPTSSSEDYYYNGNYMGHLGTGVKDELVFISNIEKNMIIPIVNQIETLKRKAEETERSTSELLRESLAILEPFPLHSILGSSIAWPVITINGKGLAYKDVPAALQHGTLFSRKVAGLKTVFFSVKSLVQVIDLNNKLFDCKLQYLKILNGSSEHETK